MRLFLAGLFVFGGVMLAVGLLSGVMEHGSPIVIGLGMLTLFIVLCVVALVIFHWPLTKQVSVVQNLRKMEEKGITVSSDFIAVRAFKVEGFDDEGPHYFVETVDGSTLYLNGQVLSDYEPIDDKPELNQPRRFPCTDFTIKRHRDQGNIVDIVCRGRALIPESVEPTFEAGDLLQGRVSVDGDIIIGQRYEEIRGHFTGTD